LPSLESRTAGSTADAMASCWATCGQAADNEIANFALDGVLVVAVRSTSRTTRSGTAARRDFRASAHGGAVVARDQECSRWHSGAGVGVDARRKQPAVSQRLRYRTVLASRRPRPRARQPMLAQTVDGLIVSGDSRSSTDNRMLQNACRIRCWTGCHRHEVRATPNLVGNELATMATRARVRRHVTRRGNAG